MDNFVELHNVTKTFKNKSVLKEVSLSIPSNEVTAIVGKNGSGKSTLLKMIGGIVMPDSGQILFQNGESVRIGYVPEVTPNVIPFTPQEYLTYMGKIRGLPKELLEQRIDHLLELFHMEEHQNTRTNYFSKGMKQKITIMQALLEETDLLIMDEPLSGLDLKTQSEFEDLLLSLKERNFNIILTCHENKLIEKVVDQMFIIHDGQVTKINSKYTPKVPMNRIVFELADSISMHALQQKITIRKSTETSLGRLIEVSINNEQTDRIVKEFLELGASIKLLEPLQQDVKDTIRTGEPHA